MIFLTNQDNYFFVVKCELDISKLVGCKIHDTRNHMYQHVVNALDLQIDEVVCNEFIISEDKVAYDSRGCTDGDVIAKVEQYINTFEM
jgi:hypothetical protein